MLFSIICTDKPGRIELRQSTCPAQLEHLPAHLGKPIETLVIRPYRAVFKDGKSAA